jgi:multiple sugar transport system permease protein
MRNNKPFLFASPRDIEQGILTAILLLTGLLVVFPFFWMLSTSFKSGIGVYTLSLVPKSPSWNSYRQMMERSNFPRWFGNSFLIASIQTISVLIFDPLVGYAFSKYRFRGKNLIFIIILSTMMIPTEMLIIPWYQMVNSFGWNNTYWALLFPGLVTAFGIFLARQFFNGVPNELLEAARIDGMSELRIYITIALPLITSALSALGIFTFLNSWNAFLWPVIAVDGYDKFTIPVGLAMFSDEARIEWGVIMAAASVATIPVFIVFIIFQRKIVEGVQLSGIKG